MCDPATLTVLAVGATVGAGAYSANSQYQSGLSQSKYLQYQAENSRLEGERAIAAGEKQSNLIQDSASQEEKRLKTSQGEFNASTKAALAAGGVQGVTASDVVGNNLSKQDLDIQALRYNSQIKSYQVKEEAAYTNWEKRLMADQYDYSAKVAKKTGKTQAISTLLGTASSTANLFAPRKS